MLVAVLGLGTMGQGIAIAAAAGGHPVRLYEEPARRDDCVEALRRRYPGPADFLVAADLAEAVGQADLVIEAVPEDLELKRAVFRQLSELAAPDALLATNTSSLPLDAIVPAVKYPERFLAAHFFNPAELVPGVEVAATASTDPGAVTRLTGFLRGIGKEPIVVAPRAGFVANRLQLALFLEALACVEDGTASREDVDLVVRRTFGFRLPAYGPFAIADMAGLDVYRSILDVLQAEYGDRFAVPETLRDLVDRGRVGVKTGAGFADYTPAEVAELLAERDDTYRRLLEAGR